MQPSKKYLYVEIYEDLYNKIKSSEYKPGDKLPSEHELSEQYEVSRGTLRQALLLLKENGYIHNIKGSGSYVTNFTGCSNITLDRLHMIPYSFAKHELKERIDKLVYEVPTTYTARQLNLNNSQLTLNCQKVYSDKTGAVAFSLISIPVKLLSKHNIDITKEENIIKFIGEIVNTAKHARARIMFSDVGDFLARKLDVSRKEKIVIVEEIYYCEDDTPLATMRHSMKPDSFEFVINRTKVE